MKGKKKIWARIIAWCMVITMLPIGGLVQNVAAATDDTTLTAALAEAKEYTDALTINNSNNDPATVVKNFKTHFTWDNEKRENSKSYLFDWSYYNGVVFEGLEYLYEVTGEENYKDYVVEYMSSMITENGNWATCSNNSSKECAGYNSTHGADCYKTASLLLDMYEMTNESRYLTIAKKLYADLDTAAASTTYSLSNAGNNYRHTWASDPSPDLWLDGLYMILPFRAEYAKHIGDTEELDLIVSRMQWVSDNMYNSSKKLFYHAADSATSNSGTYWLRAIGWYAAAIVDIMDSMDGENLEAMKKQLVKLVDGMKACQNASNGMWLNNMNATQSSTNPYETSGTALVCYAVMKAVNNGWLDASYADMATLAFKGICNEKLSGNNLTDICFKGAPGSGNSTFYDNEGKGVGPFIMFYAEVQEYVNKQAETPEEPDTPVEPEEPSDKEVTAPDGTVIKVTNVTSDVTVAEVTPNDEALIEAKKYAAYRAYDMKADLGENGTTTISIQVPENWQDKTERIVGISVEDNVVVEKEGTYADGAYSFEVDHFSAKGIALTAEVAEEDGWIELPSETKYVLDQNGMDPGSSNKYVIVGSNNDYALTLSGTTIGQVEVTINGNELSFKNADDAVKAEFYFLDNSSKEQNTYILTQDGTRTVYHEGGNLYYGSDNKGYWKVSNSTNGLYQISDLDNNNNWYLNYGFVWGSQPVDRFSVSSTARQVRLFESVTGEGGYAKLGGKLTYNYPVGSTLNINSLAETVIQTTTDKSTVKEIALTDENVTIVWNNTLDGSTAGEYVGTVLYSGVELGEIAVNVVDKKVASAVLTGNDPVTTKQNVEPDFSKIKLTVAYDDGTTGIITVDNGLVIEGYDITAIGYKYATISYGGKEYGTVRVTVEGNPYEGKEEATVYPEYPADGAVRIDKTATEVDFENTGVVQVELDVAGVTLKPAVDVILVTDLSNSMAREVGATSDGLYETTKLDDMKESVNDFADIFLAQEEGRATKNTVSLVTFGGYDADYVKDGFTSNMADSTQTLLLGSSDADTVKSTFSNIELWYEKGTATNFYLSFDGGTTYAPNYGNTNYDHAFMETSKAITNLKAAYAANNSGASYDESGRKIYVLFMTDGAPSNYEGIYYNYNKDNTRPDMNTTWLNGNNEQNYVYGSNESKYSQANWYAHISGNDLSWATTVYNMESVENIYPIGFDLDNGGFASWIFTEKSGYPLTTVLEGMVAGKTLEVFSADDSDGLSKIYADLATKIRYAGTQANVTDIVDSNFDLQLTQITGSVDATVNGDLGFKPTITVSTYELWTKEETTDSTKIGTRKTKDGAYICNVIETVSFNEDGTEAYSDKIDAGKTNIMDTAEDGTVTIQAQFFTYTKIPGTDSVESFKWNIEYITEQEVVLSYYAYLTGSMEGERPKGLYYTNEEAVLEYIDINEKHATQIFPIPAVAWGGASTSYEFYLVNEAGQPCDRDGNELPFANRIIITGPYFEELYLNQEDEEQAKEIVAAYVLPAGYTLYDETAKYEVITASGDIRGSLTISEPAEGKVQTTKVVSATEPSYIQSRVAFGVIFNKIPTEATFEMKPNEVVIDYGKSIVIDTAIDDTTVESGYTAKLVGFSKYYSDVDLKHKFTSTSAIDNYEATYGIFSIVDPDARTVRYTPTDIVDKAEMIFCVLEMHNESKHDTYYMVDWLTVIPATVMYYETNFANVFNLVTTATADEYKWKEATVEGDTESEEDTDQTQDDGTIGKDQTYGYDSTYEDDKYLSDGSSYKVEGQGIKLNDSTTKYTYAQFEFTGTGFDIISRTGADQGAIRVDIYKNAARTDKLRSITVLNKSESNLELYQIPVVSVNDLTYNTYYVTIGVNAKYDNTTYPELSRGGEFYFDAIRIYNPTNESVAIDAYKADNENNMTLIEVREQLITAADYDASIDNPGVTFVDSTYTDGNPEHETGSVEVGTYASVGPNNEVYLANGQSIVFKINWTGVAPTSIDVGAKSITGGTAHMKAYIAGNTTKPTNAAVDKDIASSTVQFQNLVNIENASTFSTAKEAYVFITNTEAGILSITDIKIGYANSLSAIGEIDLVSNENTRMFALRCFSMDIPEDIPEEDIPGDTPEVEPNYDIISAKFTTDTVVEKGTATMIVVTTSDVDRLEILKNKKDKVDATITSETNEDGEKVWTVSIKVDKTGNTKYTITGYGEDGTSGKSATASIKVEKEKKPDKPNKPARPNKPAGPNKPKKGK